MEQRLEGLVGGCGRRWVEGVKCSEFDRVGSSDGGWMWVRIVANDAETVAEGVVGGCGLEGLGGGVQGMESESGKFGRAERLGFGEVGVAGCVDSGGDDMTGGVRLTGVG